MDYIELRAKERISRRPGLGLVDIVPDSPTHKRVYLVGVKRSRSDHVHRLEIPFQVVERCEYHKSDTELLQLLDARLDEIFPA